MITQCFLPYVTYIWDWGLLSSANSKMQYIFQEDLFLIEWLIYMCPFELLWTLCVYVVIRLRKQRINIFAWICFTKILDGLKMKEVSQLSRCPFFTTDHAGSHTSYRLFKHFNAVHFAQLTTTFLFLSAPISDYCFIISFGHSGAHLLFHKFGLSIYLKGDH